METRATLLARRVCQYLPRETLMFTRRDGLKWTLALATMAAAARPGLFSPVHAAAEPVF